jgi:monoamine oxidase
MSDKSTKSAKPVSRRDFVKTAGAAAVAATATSQAVAGTNKTSSGHDYDGAGFAGVTAARETSRAGLKTVLLEARNRLGGRTFFSKFAGHDVELGGTWIHWTQPHVWSEVNHYRLGLKEEPGTSAPESMVYVSGGKPVTADPDEMWIELQKASEEFCAPGRAMYPRPFDPYFAKAEVEKWDGLSIADRLAQTDSSPALRDIMNGFWSTMTHNYIAEGGFTEMARWYALAGHDFTILNDSISRYKIDTGTISLIDAMIADGGPEVVMSIPVYSVKQDKNGVVVTTDDDQTLSARTVIMALPLNVYKDIEFSPGLSEAKMIVSRAGHAGAGTKLYIHVKQDLGSMYGIAPETSKLTFLFTDHHGPDGTILIGFGPDPKTLDVNDLEDVQRAVSEYFPEAEVLDAFGYQWNVDPYSRGTWCTLRPGHTTKYLAGLQQSEGKLHFCTGDIANGWRGFIDGAIESGQRIGRDVVKELA